MVTLNIKSFYPNSLQWELTDLDFTYSRDDRLVEFIISSNDNKFSYTNGKNINSEREIWKYKNDLYSLPRQIVSAGREWQHGQDLDLTKQYYITCKIYYSVQKIEASDWVSAPKIINNLQLQTLFPCYPNFNLGDGFQLLSKKSTQLERLKECFLQVASEQDINDLYSQIKDNENFTIPQKIDYISQNMIKLCLNTSGGLKHTILQWFPFPSGSYIYNKKGDFTWEEWIKQKQYDKLPLVTEIRAGKDILYTPSNNTNLISNIKKIDWGYSENQLLPENNILIESSIISQYKALFPPILESYQSAFVGVDNSSYKIFFKLSNYTNFEEVAHVDAKVTLQANNANVVNTKIWTDEIIYKVKTKPNGATDIANYGNNLYSITLYANASENDTKMADLKAGHWENNTYYKVQLRIGTAWEGWQNNEDYYKWRDIQIRQGQFSEWSTPMILKSIAQPKLTFINNQTLNYNNYLVSEFSTSPTFVVQYDQGIDNNGTEQLDQYNFTLYDAENNIIENSGWLQYDSSLEQQKTTVSFHHNFKQLLTPNTKYKVVVKGITKNMYELSATYNFKVIQLLNEIEPFFDGLHLEADVSDEENGVIKISIINDSDEKDFNPNNDLILVRTKHGDKKQEQLLRILKSDFYLLKKKKKTIYIDFTVENNVAYDYFLYTENALGQRGTPLTSLNNKINFEHFYLYGEGKQLKIKYNPDIRSFKNTVLTQKQDTLGGRFPVILRNGMAHYAEFPIGGLISLHSEYDGFSYFFNKDLNNLDDNDNDYTRELHEKTQKPFIKGTETQYEENFNLNLTSNNMYLEKEYRETVEEFLNNGEYKLFRSPSEGNFIVGLININLTPNQQLGRMISSFTAQAYEIAEFTIDNLKQYGIILENYNSNNSKGNVQTVVGQLAGLFSDTQNLLQIIQENMLKQGYELNKITGFTIEQYPIGLFEQQRIYAIAQSDPLLLTSIEALQNYYSTENKTSIIELNINKNGEESYNGIILPNKKYILDNLNLSLISQDFIGIKNSVPIIFTYTAEKYPQTVDSYIEYSYEVSGYRQLYGQIVTENSIYYDKNNLINTYGIKNYYSSNDLLKIIFSQLLEDLGLQINEKFELQETETKLIYNTDQFLIELNSIPWLEIEAPQDTILIFNQGDQEEKIQIGKTNKFILEDLLDKYNKTNSIQFTKNTDIIINFAYSLAILKRGE